MSHYVITYRVKREHIDQHLRNRRAVFDELAQTALRGVAWTSFRLEDGVSFFDVVQTDTLGSFSTLTTWPAYPAGLEDRCDTPIRLQPADLIAQHPPRPSDASQ